MASTPTSPGDQDVALLFTDIEASTRLWQQEPKRMSAAVAHHDSILRDAVESRRGRVIKTTGDGLYAAFADALDALDCAIAIQRALRDPAATAGFALRVRCGIHAGRAELRDADYFGDTVNHAARLMAAAHGGQILVSEQVTLAVARRLPSSMTLKSLGPARLRDFPHDAAVYQLEAPGIEARFPPPRSPAPSPHNLPRAVTSFVGREVMLASMAEALLAHRLVTLSGPGGIGKTRAALEVAASIRERYEDGAWMVELGALADGTLVPNAIAKVLGIPEEPGEPSSRR